MALNRMRIPFRITRRASFVLIPKKEKNGTFSFVFVDEMLGYKGIPGGRIDKNESEEDAARREAREETGCQVKITGLLMEGEEIIFNGAIRLIFSVYEAEVAEGELNPEPQGAKYCSRKEVEQFIQDRTLIGSYIWAAITRFYAKEKGTAGMCA